MRYLRDVLHQQRRKVLVGSSSPFLIYVTVDALDLFSAVAHDRRRPISRSSTSSASTSAWSCSIGTFGNPNIRRRKRRLGIVTLTRELLLQLWRYLETGDLSSGWR